MSQAIVRVFQRWTFVVANCLQSKHAATQRVFHTLSNTPPNLNLTEAKQLKDHEKIPLIENVKFAPKSASKESIMIDAVFPFISTHSQEPLTDNFNLLPGAKFFLEILLCLCLAPSSCSTFPCLSNVRRVSGLYSFFLVIVIVFPTSGKCQDCICSSSRQHPLLISAPSFADGDKIFRQQRPSLPLLPSWNLQPSFSTLASNLSLFLYIALSHSPTSRMEIAGNHERRLISFLTLPSTHFLPSTHCRFSRFKRGKNTGREYFRI